MEWNLPTKTWHWDGSPTSEGLLIFSFYSDVRPGGGGTLIVDGSPHLIENYYAWTGSMIDNDRLFHRRHSPDCWKRVETALRNFATLPCWIDRNLSLTVFGSKQPREYWSKIFETGKSPSDVQVLTKPLTLEWLIQE